MVENKGKVLQVIGPVVDIEFASGGASLPDIYEALEISREDGTKLIVECEQHIGENTIRSIAMDSTDGLSRDMEVRATGSPITMPIGEQVRGRLLNVTGLPIDGLGKMDTSVGYPIHREPPNIRI